MANPAWGSLAKHAINTAGGAIVLGANAASCNKLKLLFGPTLFLPARNGITPFFHCYW